MAVTVAREPSPTRGAGQPVLRRSPTYRLRRLDLASVARISLLFYGFTWSALVALSVLVYLVAGLSGLIGRSERFVASLLGFTSFHFRPWLLLAAMLGTGVVVVALGTLASVLAAGIYNLVSGVTGGVSVSLEAAPPEVSGLVRPRI